MAEQQTSLFDELEQATATPTHPLVADNDGPSPSPSPEPTDEETIYSFLFQKCDSDGCGQVAVESLVEYIHKMQSGQQGTSEEVYDSMGESQNLRYNLDLLKAMLECNSDQLGRVDETTYSHVIRKWVKNLRDHQPQLAEQGGGGGGGLPIEVSQLSDSEDGDPTTGGPTTLDFSYGSYGSGLDRSAESFETSGGGGSSTHLNLDRMELVNSLQLDNRRLQERNQELQIQLETSDEHFKSIQKENEELQGKLKGIHHSLVQLQALKTENSELTSAIERERDNCSHLKHNSEKMERDLELIREELDVARVQLAGAAKDNTTLADEMRKRLLLKEEQLLAREVAKTSLQSQLLESQQQAEALSRTVTELGQTNDQLKSSNAELQTRLLQETTQPRLRMPFSSTPYRREVPSLHDELMARDEAEKRGSISPFLVGGAEEGGEGPQTGHTHSQESVRSNASETSVNASRILDESFEHYKGVFDIHNPKIHQRSNQLVREFTDIIAAPSPTASHRSTHESSRVEVTERLSDRKRNAFESKLTDLVKSKKQLQNEKAKMAAELDELRQRNQELQREAAQRTQHQQEEVDLHVHVHDSAMQTDPPPDPVVEPVFLAPLHPTERLVEIDVPETVLPAVPASSFEDDSLETTEQVEPSGKVHESPARCLIAGQQETPGQLLLTAGQPAESLPGQSLFSGQQPESPGRKRAVLSIRKDAWSIDPTFPPPTTAAEPPPAQAPRDRATIPQPTTTSSRKSLFSTLFLSIYRILKGVALLLVITLLVLLLILGMIMLHDALDSCGTYCPHSPVQMLYETFGGHLQYSRVPSPI